MSSAPCGNWRASSPSAGCAPGPPPSTARAASPATCSTSWPSKGDLADLIIVFAKTDPDRGGRGISAFLVERGTPGLSSGGNFDKLGLRGSPAARQLAYRALQLADRRDPRLPQAGAMAKWFASEVALRAVNDAMQVLGGHGYLKDHPLERIYRDVRFVTFGEGTSEMQKLQIARHLFGEG